MKTLLFVVLLVSVLAVPVLAVNWVTNPANGHQYALIDGPNWQQLEDQSVSLGGHLVSISSTEENSWVRDLAYSSLGENNKRIWIGLYDSSGWHWSSGEAVTYKNWSPGNPSRSTSEEIYGEMYVSTTPDWYPWGSWNDNGGPAASLITVGIVEVAPVPEPSSLLALGSLVAPLALLRRRKG